jgi:glycosyltransferase involved in cell wall biosynthesis
MRICLVYDCLYPHTIGGGERWYRNLAERLGAEGHEVTYLTLRQWERGADPGVEGVEVVAVGPRMGLYGGGGTRRILPPLVFGLGVLLHLLRHGARYDVVHTASFPYFSLLAAALLRRAHGYHLAVDWFEVWSLAYWREYLGRVGGRAGWLVQRRCMRVRQRAFCFSRLHAERLRLLGLRGEVTALAGIYAGSTAPAVPQSVEPVVVFAGRHIPEKRAVAVVPAVARAADSVPELRAEILGDGPQRSEVLLRIAELGLEDIVEAPGFVASEEVEARLRRALCMVLPSRREGYGLIVVEAAALGTPSVVVRGEDNAATELIEEGVNGFVAASASPEDLAAAIVSVHEAGEALRERTAGWFAHNAHRLSLEQSLATVVRAYGGRPQPRAGASAGPWRRAPRSSPRR